MPQVPYFSDIYKLFYYATKKSPLEALESEFDVEGVGVTSPDADLDIRHQFWGGSQSPLRVRIGDSTDFVDLSSVTNRSSRYKEYERLENIPEIHTALNTFADEACLGGDTLIATPFGFISIKELAETKNAEERFLVYCWDFDKNDYTLGWAFHPRKVKRAKTIKVMLDDGTAHYCTSDHRFLLSSGEWIEAGNLEYGNKLKPFYRLPARTTLTKLKTKQFARIFTFNDGWKNERQFLDEWKTGKDLKQYERVNKLARLIASGCNMRQTSEVMGIAPRALEKSLHKEGFSYKELKWLGKEHEQHRMVVGAVAGREEDVYDLSVEDHENFATNATIVHNCQMDEKDHVFTVKCSNEDVKEELDFLMHKLLKLDDRAWGIQRNLCKLGDQFFEVVIDPNAPKKGILKIQVLPADSMYRIESIKGRIIEYQQSKEGPDYLSLSTVEITKASNAQLMQATALRFHPQQIVHARIGDDRKTFYPYGISVIEAARGPAHQLRLMEDAMLVYRLTRAPERRVFYIDVGTTAPNRAEAFMERLKDQFRKKKVFSRKKGGGAQGASAVEERWHSMPPDEDYWFPIRPNSQSRIETLPGAENLGEIDDALYFRQRLFTALQFPKNYLTNEDPQATRLTLSQQDVRFARLIERLQKPFARALLEIGLRHLTLRGFPEDSFRDLEIKITPPSDWRQINRNEVTEVLYNRAATLKGSQIMSDYDILIRILGFEESDAKDIVGRTKAQKMEDLKMQVIGQNPDALGLTQMADEGQQIGAGPGGPTPMLTPGGEAGALPAPPAGPEGAPGGAPASPGGAPEGAPGAPGAPEAGAGAIAPAAAPTPGAEAPERLPEPEEEDIRKYNLDISDYSKSMDDEEVDVGELDED